MEAVTSGRYDTDHLALIMSQTGGCCRASNYIAFIRRALKKAGPGAHPRHLAQRQRHGDERGLPHFARRCCWTPARGIVLGDVLMRCLYRVRPVRA